MAGICAVVVGCLFQCPRNQHGVQRFPCDEVAAKGDCVDRIVYEMEHSGRLDAGKLLLVAIYIHLDNSMLTGLYRASTVPSRRRNGLPAPIGHLHSRIGRRPAALHGRLKDLCAYNVGRSIASHQWRQIPMSKVRWRRGGRGSGTHRTPSDPSGGGCWYLRGHMWGLQMIPRGTLPVR